MARLEAVVLHRIVPLLLLAVTIPFACFAQQRQPRTIPSIPSPNTNRDVRLEIQLVDENSRPLHVQALVEIMSFGAISMRAYTNTDGRVTFSARSGSTYRAQVSGGGLKSDEASFEIFPGEMSHRETLTVRETGDAENRPGAPGGMVSAAQLNVPKKARKEYEKGMDAFRDKKWDKAREHFEKAVNEYPQFDWAHNNLGVVAMQQGDVPRAKGAFKKAIEANVRNAAASRNLGRVFLTTDRDPVQAKAMLQQSLSADPRSAETMALLSYAALQTGDLELALSNAKKVHGAAPQDEYPFAHLVAGRVHESKGDKDAAAAEYRAYLKEAENTQDAKTAREGLARLGQSAQE